MIVLVLSSLAGPYAVILGSFFISSILLIYVEIFANLPSLEIGTVGGGTSLEDQSYNLSLLGVNKNKKDIRKFFIINVCLRKYSNYVT